MASLNLNQDPKNFIVKGTHGLKIRGFSSTKGMGIGQCISSDIFSVGGHLWQIQFYPDGFRRYDKIYVSLYIALVSKCEEGVEAYFENVLFDQNGIKWHMQSDGKVAIRPHMSGPFMVKVSWGYELFYKRTELQTSIFIKDDCLTIRCTIGVVKTSMDFPKPLVQLSDMGQSYKQLLESKEGSDVSFEVEGELFYAHKIILSTRSSVFKAQFFGSLKEENTQFIRIEEMQARVFKTLLQFIYCDAIPDVGEEFDRLEATTMTQHLLVVADRYRIERLRTLCELRLCEILDIDTVASSLALAEQYSCFQLKSMCLEFIGLPENIEGVMQTNGFKNLKENYPAVIIDLLESIARAKSYTCVTYEPGNEK